MSSTISTTTVLTITNTAQSIFVAYYPLFLIIVGTILNLTTFIVLCRAPFRDTKKQPTMHYMRTIAIFDILMLYGWNLNHYLLAQHGLDLFRYTIASCKYVSFFSYFTTQTSAWLRVFVCFDRYVSLSRLNRTWFGKSKSVLIIIGCIIGVFFGFNFHILLFACYYKKTGGISANAPQYKIYPLWDNIHLGIYNCAPFVLMVIFNSGVIYRLARLRRTTTVHNSRVHHRSVSITLVITTFLFLVMAIPSGAAFAFFQNTAGPIVLTILDDVYFTYHILSFPLYMITFTEFRREFISIIKCSNRDRVVPLNTAPVNTLSAARIAGLRTSVGDVTFTI